MNSISNLNDSNMSNAAVTTVTTTTTTTNMNGNDQVNLPFGRLESTLFGTYDIWQEKTIIGKKSPRHEVDVNIGTRNKLIDI